MNQTQQQQQPQDHIIILGKNSVVIPCTSDIDESSEDSTEEKLNSFSNSRYEWGFTKKGEDNISNPNTNIAIWI